MSTNARGKASALLLAPMPYDDRIWGRFSSRLADFMEVTAATWPGYGPEPRANTDRQLDMLVEVARVAARITGAPDVVVTVSGEAAVAVHLAARGLARAIVLINPVPNGVLTEVPIDLESELAEAFAGLPDVMSAIEARDMAALASAIAEPSRHRLTSGDFDTVTTVITDNIDRFTDRIHYSAGSEAFWPDQLGQLDVPVLILAQTKTQRRDDLLGRYAAALTARCRNGRLERIEAETEFPWLEQPETLARMVTELADTL